VRSKLNLLLLLFILIGNNHDFYAQISKRQLTIVNTTIAPKIDGVLEQQEWQNAAIADNFIQYAPYNGHAPAHPTVVKIMYDDKALYIGAMMYDSSPDSISRTLGQRDIGFNDNADYIAVTIGPYNDGINMNMFLVSASGVQSDIKATSADDDMNWDAVWKSAVKIGDNGWGAELRIPFSELRYSNTDNQAWAFNFYRKITKRNEWSSWNYVNNKIEGHANQTGELTGFVDLKPNLRLSFTPYLSLLAEYNSETAGWSRGIRGGVDVKYGISESFTLDMMLIPDFAQVQTDDKVLNLSPFEVRYDENRPFFKEGAELFSKGEIYYSKRIGGLPRNYWQVWDKLNDNEKLVENPSENQIINATKISGRTKKGLGIGIFNAVTSKSIAKITDTLSFHEREFITQPATNYNMVVFDQVMRHNSHFSLVNTNVAIPGEGYTGNVSAIDFKFKNKPQTYQFRGVAGFSQIYARNKEDLFGFSYDITFEKTAGKFQFGISQELFDDKYNPNDLGYLSYNNYIETRLFLRHKILKPYKSLVEYGTYFSIEVQNRFAPFDFMSAEFDIETFFTFKNYWTTGFFMGVNPVKTNNFHEPRAENRVHVEPENLYSGIFLSSDSRKKFFFSSRIIHWNSFSEYDQDMKSFSINPNLRAGSRFIVGINSEVMHINNSLGYASQKGEEIFFGRRQLKTFDNSISADYSFDEKMRLTFRLRHYLSSAEYLQYYLLNGDGSLSPYSTYDEDENISFNAFNIDMVFSWRFAPGSDLLLVWKNAIYSTVEKIEPKFVDNIVNTFNSPYHNHFSIKVLYYLDYNYFRKKS
jgi:hypothetical protein